MNDARCTNGSGFRSNGAREGSGSSLASFPSEAEEYEARLRGCPRVDAGSDSRIALTRSEERWREIYDDTARDIATEEYDAICDHEW